MFCNSTFSFAQDIYKFFSVLDLRTNRGVLEFFLPVFKWIDEAVNSGRRGPGTGRFPPDLEMRCFWTALSGWIRNCLS